MLNHCHQGCGDPEQEGNSSGLHTPRRAILVSTQPQLMADSGAEEEDRVFAGSKRTLREVAAVSEQCSSLNDVWCRMKEECMLLLMAQSAEGLVVLSY